ncbi:TolC family protein [Seleniivibrio woodruffii]|uniref:Outer membrane protein TolC n=1 Tax=Seleniivibrio woodruffii TaxID=1078050 RepID=A0A4R1KCV5_9BACT|nr:TolC family protein [Seleniivibrio woodruffii]TCK62385.1 outer membrane protein TolC [Seleniivibrio woodruffii]TVZ34497.1 outer membrane protein TolC [Seleniivibrio woodruffii]
MKRFVFLIILSVPLLANAATLTLREAIALGLQNNYSILIEKSSAEAKKELITAEDAKFDPVAGGSVSAGGSNKPTDYAPYNMDYLKERTLNGSAQLQKLHKNGMTGKFSFETQKTGTNNSYNELDPAYRTVFYMNIIQPILKNYGKDINATGTKNAELTFKQAQYQLYSEMTATAANIETAYYAYVRATDVLELSKTSEELAKNLLEYDKKRFAAGIVPITEVQQAQTALAGRREQTVNARAAADTALINLQNLINSPLDRNGTAPEKLSSAFIQADGGQFYKTALDASPLLEKQRVELKKQDITLKYLKNQELPELDALATLGVIGLSGNARDDSHFDGTYHDSLTDMTEGDGFEWKVGLSISYPLGARGAKARTASVSAEKMRAVYALKKMENDTRSGIDTALTAMDSGKSRYLIAQEFVGLASVTLEQEMKKLNEGLSDTFRILKFQEDLTDARIRSVNALYEYRKGEAELYRTAGTNLDRFGFKAGE